MRVPRDTTKFKQRIKEIFQEKIMPKLHRLKVEWVAMSMGNFPGREKCWEIARHKWVLESGRGRVRSQWTLWCFWRVTCTARHDKTMGLERKTVQRMEPRNWTYDIPEEEEEHLFPFVFFVLHLQTYGRHKSTPSHWYPIHYGTLSCYASAFSHDFKTFLLFLSLQIPLYHCT